MFVLICDKNLLSHSHRIVTSERYHFWTSPSLSLSVAFPIVLRSNALPLFSTLLIVLLVFPSILYFCLCHGYFPGASGFSLSVQSHAVLFFIHQYLFIYSYLCVFSLSLSPSSFQSRKISPTLSLTLAPSAFCLQMDYVFTHFKLHAVSAIRMEIV